MWQDPRSRYAYDNAGRPISQGGSLAATDLLPAATSVSYDAANSITSWNGTAYSYDSNGNLVSDGSSTYTWNSRNQLTAISGANSASFSYDGLGRRRARTVGGTTQYLYVSACLPDFVRRQRCS